MEIMKSKEFPKYEVSNQGQYRMVGNQNWLRGSANKNGYCYATLQGKTMSVHRLVWETFNGRIEDGKEVDHINCNPSDNRLENLDCITMKANRQKASRKENHKLRNIAKTAHQLKRTIKGINLETNEEKYFSSKTGASKFYGCSPSLVYLICEKKNNAKTFGGTITFKYCEDEIGEDEITKIPHGRKGQKYGKHEPKEKNAPKKK